MTNDEKNTVVRLVRCGFTAEQIVLRTGAKIATVRKYIKAIWPNKKG